MTINRLRYELNKLCAHNKIPDFGFESDRQGQLVIYTGLTSDDGGINLREMKDEDFDKESFIKFHAH